MLFRMTKTQIKAKKTGVVMKKNCSKVFSLTLKGGGEEVENMGANTGENMEAS